MKAVLLVAGLGKRFYPFSHTRSKHMIPVAGRPLLEHTLRELKEAGIEEILLVVNYKREILMDYFEDGSALGLDIQYVKQDFSLGKGTGIATSFAREFVGDDSFLLTYGDLQYDAATIKGILKQYNEENPDALLALLEIDDPSRYGVIELDDSGKAQRIVEKPKPGESDSKLTNVGIYIFKPIIFDAIDNTGLSPRGEIELTDSIQILIDDGRTVIGHDIKDGWWRDIGRASDLLYANKHYFSKIKKKILGTIEPNVHIKGDVFIGENTLVRSGVYIQGPVFIGNDCDIGPNTYLRPNTFIGNRCRVGNACEVKASIIMNGTKISHLSYVGDSVIGENVNFGAATIAANLRLDKKDVEILDNGRRVSTGMRKLGVLCGDNVNVGCNVNLEPGVSVGANTIIGPNIVISEDIEPNSLVYMNQEVLRGFKTVKKREDAPN
ncbi:NTP transferase domain-containing protein [Candidatus Bathyarchaeota archaeon]|nr:NTP transferase domain-containing protein [Candidatus Bathyarchaeota archaeon]